MTKEKEYIGEFDSKEEFVIWALENTQMYGDFASMDGCAWEYMWCFMTKEGIRSWHQNILARVAREDEAGCWRIVEEDGHYWYAPCGQS